MSKTKYDYTVKRSSAGLGLFATKDIPKGQRIIEYKGPILNEKQVQEKGGKYLFEINRKETIDGSSRKNTARYINHSCKPNCEPIVRKGQVFIKSTKAIKEGEEFTYDYGKEYFNEFIKPYGCRCPKCTAKRKLPKKR